MNIRPSVQNGYLQYARTSSFKEAFNINRGEIVSLVGGGGKTTLMFAIAHELATTDSLVVTTTTTKIFRPLYPQTQALYLGKDQEEIIRQVSRNADSFRHITIAGEKLAHEKLRGISPELVTEIARLRKVAYVIVEADGAAHKPLKAPNATEPVIPISTSLVIPVVGVEAIGCRLSKENVFRPEVVSALLCLPLGEVISAESIANLITHKQGMAKGCPAQARLPLSTK